jgi:formate-dependent nitrite reductase cytochrome c552 subunit
MSKKLFLLMASIFAIVLFSGLYFSSADAEKSAPADKPVKGGQCYDCHADIKDFHTKGKHAKVSCNNCHEGLNNHLKDASQKPVTKMDLATCGKCHKNEYDSLVSVDIDSRAKIEKATFKSRSPLFDKLLAPHGFTKEHDEPRSHVFMLLDHLIVDRAYGGRFQLNTWKSITDAKGSEKNLWSLLVDKEPGTSDQKAFLPQTATAANPVCFQCKTQDTILQWKYMGDKDPRAKWDRTSKVVELARSVSHPMNCFMCHDPHSAKPRVVRDALIQAVVDRGEGTYPYDKEKSKKTTMTKVMFRDDFRAIGVLNKPDSNVLCAQCHVEYTCNPGVNTETGKPVGMGEPVTNFFSWVNIFDYNKKMADQKFKDFKHGITGASLSKLQHPDTESFWGSKHEKAGVECKDCHMPRVKEGGKEFTWHGQKSARYMLKDTCVKCHPNWTPKEAEYQVDAIQNYVKGKMTKAEFWLGQFIDTFAKAKSKGVSESVLGEARKLHDTAHTYWEWWTAENSDGFHNPEAARESLARSIDTSQKGIKLLNDAMTPATAAK